MLLKAFNAALIEDREKTYLTAACAASATTLTVADTNLAPAGTSSNTWADNDYMLVGNFGEDTAEIMQMSAAVTSATSMTIDREGQAGGTRYAHPVGTPIYRINFNQVEFNRSATDSTTGVAVLTTINLQPDDLFTSYEDTTNTTGYGFVRFKNATTSAYSSYSDGVNYDISGTSSSRDPKTLWSLRKKVRQLLDEQDSNKLKDSMIDEALNDKQRDIAHQRLWSFYEVERSLSSVENQFAYDIPSTVQKVHAVRFDTQPLLPVNKTYWDMLHWDSNQSSADPTHIAFWNNQILLYPRPNAAAANTTLNANITAAATSIYIVDGSSFNRGDYYRFIIDDEVIYSTDLEHDSTVLTANVALADVTINVSDTTDFPSSGTFVIDDDVITYTGTTSTTFTGVTGITATHDSGDTVELYTFNNCLRGREDTTAATHTATTTVTERDIVYTGHVEPTNLIDTQDRTTIPEPDVLATGAASELAPFVNKETLHDRLLLKFEKGLKELESKYATKQSAFFGRIKNQEEVLSDRVAFKNPNLFPHDLT